uniref:WYL domain-containing protein n=1 Tax=Dictyoglomus turgidum TaxID=513050 RepID=A0A7C3SMS8_9BACT
MLTSQDLAALEKATANKLQVVINYTKKTTGEAVTHVCGIYEIGYNKAGEPCVWGWDVNSNDNIRQFLISNIDSIQILDVPFYPPHPWPIKINGQIIG